MEYDDVYEVEDHAFCSETGYCKRCGEHMQKLKEMGYTCRFSLNLRAISHIRAAARLDEQRKKQADATREFIKTVRERIRSSLADQEERITETIEKLRLRKLEPVDE